MLDIADARPSVARREPSRLPLTRAVLLALGFASLATAAIFMCYLTFVASGQVDPLSSTMSNYVFVGGLGWMFPAAVIATALAGLTALLGLSGTGLLTGRLLRTAMVLATVATLLVAMFPTNRVPPMTVSAQIHRYAAGVAFCCVPLAALLVAARLPRTSAWLRCRGALRVMGFGAAVVLAVFLASHLGVSPEAMQELRGLFQRALFLLQLAVLGLLLHVGRRTVPYRAPRGIAEPDPQANSTTRTANVVTAATNSATRTANVVTSAAGADSRTERECAMQEVRPASRVA